MSIDNYVIMMINALLKSKDYEQAAALTRALAIHNRGQLFAEQILTIGSDPWLNARNGAIHALEYHLDILKNTDIDKDILEELDTLRYSI